MTTNGKTFPVLARVFSRSRAKRSSSPATSPPRTTCFDIFSPPPGDSDVISHVDRLSSNETKIAPRSVRIAVGASGRSATVCMVTSRVGGSNLTLPKCRSLSTPHGILKQGHQPDSGGWVKIDDYRCREAFRHFMNLLNRAVYGAAFRRYGKRLRVLPVLEKGEVRARALRSWHGGTSGRWHIHCAIELPSHFDAVALEGL